MKLETLVLATDFSPAARVALGHAIAIATRFGAKLYLFHAVDLREPEGVHLEGNDARVDEFYELAERRAREELERIREELGPTGAPSEPPIPIVECVRIGSPSEEVVRFATDKRADLIVVGTRGLTGLKRVLVGSVAETVLRHAPCPVLAVRVPESEVAAADESEPRSEPLGRIVCAVDGTDSSRAALRAACELAKRFDAGVTAVNVVDDYVMAQAGMLSQLDAVSIEGRFSEIARTNLDEAVLGTVGGECGRGIRRRVELGRPAETIARVAASEGARLIACGTHGRRGLARALFGSVAEQIVRLAPCPVLTVREGKPAARLAA